MAKTDTMVSLDAEDSAQILEMVEGLELGASSPNPARAPFGSARKPSLSRPKEPSQRDSQTLPWKNPMRYSTPRKDSVGARSVRPPSTVQPVRSPSPDIDTILARTPRPRRVSTTGTPSSPRVRSTPSSRTSPQSGQKRLPEPSLSLVRSAIFEDESDDGEGGSESDSSIDIHTPLPHLMFRDGLLSPRSKLLPQTTSTRSVYSAFGDRDASKSVISLASTAGSVTTKSGFQKDPRDTERRRVRHRDGRLLKAGMGLTTGLGWSDSEDEDAPSTLTRRLIASTIERQSASPSSSSRPSSMFDSSPSRLTSPTPSTSSRIIPSRSSHSSLRSASVSFPPKSPSIPISAGTGLRIPRSRAASAASASSHPKPRSPLPPLASSPELDKAFGAIAEATLIKAGFASPLTDTFADETDSLTASSLALLNRTTARARAESSASTASMLTTTSLSSAPPRPPPKSAPVTPRPPSKYAPVSSPKFTPTPLSPSKSSPAPWSSPKFTPAPLSPPRSAPAPLPPPKTAPPAAPVPVPVTPSRPPSLAHIAHMSTVAPPPLRARTESTGSNATAETAASSASSYSQGSAHSSSTSVPSSSGCSTGSVPRPLRLPQAHAAGGSAASIPAHIAPRASNASMRSFSIDHGSSGAPVLQRPRTFSNPQVPDGVRTTANSLSSGVLPPGAPPTLRQRPTPPGGARPRPRTGTGMVYRTSSYSSAYTSFHEGGARMQGASVASP